MGKQKKRLGIFVFFDKDGFVGKYVEYLLKEIKRNVSDLYIVSNGELPNESKEKLHNFTQYVYIRENKGYDGGAYKDVLLNVIGPSNYKKWDELLLVNDTFYGPFCPLSSLFDMAELSKCDVWGLYINGERERPDMYMYEHIQAYFLVIKSRLLWDRKFEGFWRNMKETNSYLSTIKNFEVAFSKYVVDNGFTYDALVNNTFLEKSYSKKAIDWTHFRPLELLEKNSFPIIKRKALMSQGIFLTDALQIIDYIKAHTDYDIRMIWEDMLHKYNMEQLISDMNLVYIIDENKKICNALDKQIRSVLIVQIQDIQFSEQVLGYLLNICKVVNIYFLIQNKNQIQNIKQKYKFAQVYSITNEQERISFWKRVSNEYDYIGYIDLDSLWGYDYFATHLLIEMVFRNLIKNERHFYHIYDLMMKEDLLGMLMPPVNRYDYDARYVWGQDAFWIKGECLRTLYDQNDKVDVGCLPEALRLCGYYSAVVQSDDYAKRELLGFYQQWDQIKSRAVFWTPEPYIEEFWFKYTEKYIYGTGLAARKVTEYLKRKGWDHFDGYIVTKKIQQQYEGKKVFEIDEIGGSNVGVILALNNENAREVIPLLNCKEEIHYFLIRGMEI